MEIGFRYQYQKTQDRAEWILLFKTIMNIQIKRRPHLEAFFALLAMNALTPNIMESTQDDPSQRRTSSRAMVTQTSVSPTPSVASPLNREDFK
jgi:hypothetical protein